MIFLDYLYQLPNATNGLDTIGTQTITTLPGLMPMILLFVFFVVFLGGVARQKARTGTADYSMWAVVASISTLLLTLVASVSSGFIRLDWLAIVVTITIFSGVWLFLDRRQSEV